MANCNYKVSIKDIQNKYKFKIFSPPRGEKGETGNIGTPLVASSTSEMTDTTRNYINTTDGHWYYYANSTWNDGGLYQATELEENSIKYSKLEKALQNNIIFNNATKGEISVTGAYIDGNVGSTATATALSGWKYGVMEVSNGDTIVLNCLGYMQYTMAIFTDDNDIVISKYYTFSNLVDNKLILSVPENATKLYFNVINQSGNYDYYRPIKINDFSYQDNRFVYSSETTTITPSEIKDKIIYSGAFWNYSFTNGYKTYVYDVTPNSKIHLTTNRVTNNTYYAAIFTDDNFIGTYGAVGKYSDTTLFDEDIIVPNLATKMLVVTYYSTPSVSKYSYNLSSSLEKKLLVDYTNGILTISNKYNGNNIVFKNFGGNNLFMIYSYKVNGTTILTSSDMTPAPYIVTAINNINGDDLGNYTFTGGNHQYNNQGSGSTATASQQSLHIYCDNTELTNGSIECDKVKIVEVNKVQATNTKKSDGTGREVLQETITFNFDGTHLKVHNVIQPLEEIRIITYYGIQICLFSDSLYKVYADKIYDVNTVSNVPSKPYAIVGNNLINAKLYDGGLGSYTYNTTSTKARISNSKSYYVPINSNTTNFTTNETYYISGEYIFDKNPEL